METGSKGCLLLKHRSWLEQGKKEEVKEAEEKIAVREAEEMVVVMMERQILSTTTPMNLSSPSPILMNRIRRTRDRVPSRARMTSSLTATANAIGACSNTSTKTHQIAEDLTRYSVTTFEVRGMTSWPIGHSGFFAREGLMITPRTARRNSARK